MAKTESIVLNNFVTERRRTTSRGTKSHFTVDIKSEQIRVNLDQMALGAAPAVAAKNVLSKQIKSITQIASDATLVARKYAEAAFNRNASWAMRRYSGGKTGATPPNKSPFLFNDSGRMADNLTVRANKTEESFTVNVPVNRFDESTFKNRGQFLTMLDRLRSLVPGLRAPDTLLQEPEVQHAIQETLEKVFLEKGAMGEKLKEALYKSAVDLVRTVLGTADEIVEE